MRERTSTTVCVHELNLNKSGNKNFSFLDKPLEIAISVAITWMLMALLVDNYTLVNFVCTKRLRTFSDVINNSRTVRRGTFYYSQTELPMHKKVTKGVSLVKPDKKLCHKRAGKARQQRKIN